MSIIFHFANSKGCSFLSTKRVTGGGGGRGNEEGWRGKRGGWGLV